MSERRACTLVAADRTMIRYRSRRPPDTALRARLHELANERRRFGYRRLFILLRREGEASGINRIYRLYRDEALFFGLEHARHAIAEWTEEYNTGRPHSALDYQTLAAFAAKLTRIFQWQVIRVKNVSSRGNTNLWLDRRGDLSRVS